MDYNFEIAKKVYEELDSLDFNTSDDKLGTAQILCKRYGIGLSDLILYENYLKQQGQS